MIAPSAVLPRALVLAALLSFVGASCGPSAVSLMPGVINDVHNRSLRKDILAYGVGKVCAEVQSRSRPLKLAEDQLVEGRFVPFACSVGEAPSGNLVLELKGLGFMWTKASLRVGFEAGSVVEYETDFLLDGATMYVYFRPRGAMPPSFATKVIEQQQAAFFSAVFGGAPGQSMSDRFGSQMMAAQLARPFTVVRRPDGTVEIAAGVLPPGQHVPPVVTGLDAGKRVLVDEASLVHLNQRDFVPFEVPGPARSQVTLLVGVDGAPAIDVLLVPRALGDAWLTAYATHAATTPPPGPPIVDEAVPAGAVWRRAIEVEPGPYYLVIDHTATAGRTAPPNGVGEDRGAFVSYGVEID